MFRLHPVAVLLIILLPLLACTATGPQQVKEAEPVADSLTIDCPTASEGTPGELTTAEPTIVSAADDQDYDQPPRPVKITRPQYPTEAFDKKIEGVVMVEILIETSGRVSKARVIQSVPLLDEAAARSTCRWIFLPAMKDGQALPATAHAPITFRIY